MHFVEREIESQPACWRAAVSAVAQHRAALPSAGEKVAVIGCGTSWFMAQAYAAARELAGQGRTDAFAASEMPPGRRYDRVLALTRSGTTTEVLDALDRCANGACKVAITAVPHPPLAETVDDLVLLEFADERSVVQTRFATTTLALLRAALGQDLEPALRDADAALDAPLEDEVVAAEQIAYLGRGWTVGLAHEAALKLRESATAWSESYPAMEYRHGPISIAGPGRVVWMFGDAPNGLRHDVAQTGATFVASDLDPLAELIRAQRVAVAKAKALGLDPDNPRHLARSVILEG